MKMPLENLRDWFEKARRDFPWRGNPSPYQVWVSEVMLQQTRASVVVPYFLRWFKHFPTVESLANASVDEVIKLWEGLGYYSRARNLHAGAQYLLSHHKGEVPSDEASLQKVKGLGPYTIGAILSFAFHQKAAAIDGNVSRVISRLYCIEEVLGTVNASKKIKTKVDELLPDTKPWVIMEALIELGATVCTPKPNCSLCPMQDSCQGYQKGKEETLPLRKKRVEVTRLNRIVPLICHKGAYLVQKHQGKKVMTGLYEFPYFSKGEPWDLFYPGRLEAVAEFEQVKHTYTRFQVTLYPVLWHAEEREEVEGFCWKSIKALSKLPFSSGHRKILAKLEEAHADFTH